MKRFFPVRFARTICLTLFALAAPVCLNAAVPVIETKIMMSVDYISGSWINLAGGVSEGNVALEALTVIPGVTYLLEITPDTNVENHHIKIDFTASPGYRIEVNGNPQNGYEYEEGNSQEYLQYCAIPLDDDFNGRAGTVSPLTVKDGTLQFHIAMGELSTGGTAGSLNFTYVSGWNFQYRIPDSEIKVLVDGDHRQIVTKQVVADMPNPWEVRFFPIDRATPHSGNELYTFSGFPYVTYTFDPNVENPKILSETRDLNLTSVSGTAGTTVIGVSDSMAPIRRTAETSYTLDSNTWVIYDWHTVGQTPLVERRWEYTTSGGNTLETIHVRPYGLTTDSSYSQRVLANYSWGLDVYSVREGSGSNAVTRSFDYYTGYAFGSFRQVKSIATTGGGWEAFEYDPNRVGVIKFHHKPFNGYPSSIPSTLAGYDTGGATNQFWYAEDADGLLSRPTLIETTVHPASDISYTTSQSNAEYSTSSLGTDQYMVTATRHESNWRLGTSSYVQTIRKYYEGASLVNHGKTYSVQFPDGRKDSYLYLAGSFTGSAFSGTTTNSVVTVHGNASGSSEVTSFFGNSMDSIYLVANKSTAEIVTRALGFVVATRSLVWNGSAWAEVAFSEFSYNLAGQCFAAYNNKTGAVSYSTYEGEQKTSDTSETGVITNYGYDVGGRLITVTKAAAGSTIGALTTTYTYDSSGRITTEVVSQTTNSETLTTSRTFDDAGRLLSQSVPGQGGTLTTYFAYNPGSRTVTTTLPGGNTIVETRDIDGRMVSLTNGTGTSVVPQYFTYGVNVYGMRFTRVDYGTSSSSRWAASWIDWLGRPFKTEKPGFTGQDDYVEENLYDDSTPGTGHLLKTTRSGYAATFYEYDDFGNLARTGLDVSGNDAIATNSTDRITDTEEKFEEFDSAWWLTRTTTAYPWSNGNELPISRIRQRLTAFGSDVHAEEQTTDVFGNTTVRQTKVFPSTKTVTVTTTTNGVSNSSTQTIVNGFPTSTLGFDGITFSTGYDALHRASTSVDPRAGTTTTAYATGSTLVQSITDAASNVVATYVYDSAGRVVEVDDAASKKAYTSYNDLGQIYRQWGDTTIPVEYGYNAYGERTTMKTYRDGSGWTSSSWPSSPGTADTTTWAYDGPSGLLTSKTDAGSKTVSFTYNIRGQTLTRTLARGNVATYGYSSSTGELTSVTYTGTGSSGMTDLTYTYNRLGLMATTVDAAGTRTFDYDSSYPMELDSITQGSFFGSRALVQLQDSYHRPAGIQVSGEMLQEYGFDAAKGRLSTIDTTPNGQSERTFTYSYTTNGLLAGVTDGTLAVTREYEDHRNLLKYIDSQWSSSSKTRFDYTYDTRGRRATGKQSGSVFADYKDASSTTTPIYYQYAYDDRGQLTSGTGYLGSTVSSTAAPLPGRAFQYGYDNAGNRTSANNDGGSANVYASNARNQYTSRNNFRISLSGTAGVAPVTSPSFVSGTDVLIEGQTAFAARQGTFWFDSLQVSNDGAPWHGTEKIYSRKATANGGAAGDAAKVESRTAEIPQRTQSFTYDDDGNLTSDGIWDYSFDSENQLTVMESNSTAVSTGYTKLKIEFKYDSQGRRVQKQVSAWVSGAWSVSSTRRFLYDGWSLVGEYSVSGSTLTLERSYTWGPGTSGAGALLQIRQHTGTAATYLPTYDGNGNVASLLNASGGGMVAAYEYSPFGELLRKEGTYADENPFRFSTTYADKETGLSYYGMRYYSASLGRFINRDPIAEAGGLNLYGFCGNDGISGVDVLGMQSDDNWNQHPWTIYIRGGSGDNDGYGDEFTYKQASTHTYSTGGGYGQPPKYFSSEVNRIARLNIGKSWFADPQAIPSEKQTPAAQNCEMINLMPQNVDAPPGTAAPASDPLKSSPGLPTVKADPKLVAELEKSARGRHLLDELKKGNAVIIVADTSKLTKQGIPRTHGRYIPPVAAAHLGIPGDFAMVIDSAKIKADGAPGNVGMTEEAYTVYAVDNEFKAFELRNDPKYKEATESGKQKIELAEQAKNPTAGVTEKLRQAAQSTANSPDSVYATPQVYKITDIQLPPGAVRLGF